MKYILIATFIFFHQVLNAQVITTYASGSAIYDPNCMAFDAHGSLYVTTLLGCTVVKIDTDGIITTIAGTGSSGFSGDGGAATNAMLNIPLGIAIDSIGNVFFTDQQNQRIRKIDAVTGIISTIMGTGPGGYSTGGFSGDGGPASAAQLKNPSTICFDKLGNLYIADVQNYRIRKINTLGFVSTIAGNGILGDAGDGGHATAAKIYPTCVCLDDIGNLYFSQWGVLTSGSRVRKINTSGIITTIAGDSLCTYNGDGIPAISARMGAVSLVIYNGLLYLSDACNKRVRYIDAAGIIHTVAGNGSTVHSGDSGPATGAGIPGISGITFDKCGNLYIAQVNNPRIRKVTYNPTPCPNLGVEEQHIQPIAIYPNPATDEVHVDNLIMSGEYMLLNVTGIIEQRGILKKGGNTLPVTYLPHGVYMLLITDQDGKRTVHKVVKE